MAIDTISGSTTSVSHEFRHDVNSITVNKRLHEEKLNRLSKTQRIVLECLEHTGSVFMDAKVQPDTDLTEVLQNSGLDSSQMLIFKSALEKRMFLPAPIPVTTLINAQTLQALENELTKITVSSSRQLLLPFATEGTKVPLFLFPPGGGELHCWIELVRYLPDRPIYGLRLRGLQPGETAFDSMAEMVECFVREIRLVQHTGPYALLGMCFGGNVAFEVAKALEAEGEVVSFVGGIDNAPHIPQMSFAALRFFIIDLLTSRRLITTSEQQRLKKELDDVDPATFPELMMRRFRTRLETAGVTRERLEAWYRVFCGTVHIGENYRPDGKIATYTSFWAAPLSEWNISKDEWKTRVQGWKDLAHESTFHHVKGDHYTALTRDHIYPFQQVLSEELKLHGI